MSGHPPPTKRARTNGDAVPATQLVSSTTPTSTLSLPASMTTPTPTPTPPAPAPYPRAWSWGRTSSDHTITNRHRAPARVVGWFKGARLVGVNHHNDRTVPAFGVPLAVARDPNNAAHQNAIGVYRWAPDGYWGPHYPPTLVGYVQRGVADLLAPLMDDGSVSLSVMGMGPLPDLQHQTLLDVLVRADKPGGGNLLAARLRALHHAGKMLQQHCVPLPVVNP